MLRANLFQVDDRVKVAGYLGNIFTVVSVSYIENYVFGTFYYGYLYKLRELNTYEILDNVFEDDIIPVKDHYKDFGINRIDDNVFETQIKWNEYEGYLKLFDETGDEKYQDAAVKVYGELIHKRDKF